jgi:two-component system, NtrC family, sensor kinase
MNSLALCSLKAKATTMLRRFLPLFQSLELRLLIPLSVTVAIVLATHAYISFGSAQDRFRQLVHAEAERSSGLIKMAMHDGMLANRLDDVQETIEQLSQQPEVVAIRVYDKVGAVVLSADTTEHGQTVELESPICASCHAADQAKEGAALQRCRLIRVPGGTDVMRHLTVIENDPTCASADCHFHPSDTPILAVLDVEMSIQPLNDVVLHSRQQLVTTTSILILVIATVAAVYVRRVVHRPVSALYRGTQRIAAGDFDTRIDVRGGHELALLGDAFNRMAEDLRDAQREVTDWSQSLEDKVREKTEELEGAQRQVLHMEKMGSLGKLAATVAHELNNPISGMLTYARLVEREIAEQPLEPAVQEELGRYLSLLAKECSRCGTIVHNLLSFARQKGAEMTAVDVNEIVDRSVALMRHHLEMCNVEVEVIPLRGDGRLTADGNQLQQALVALIVNASEAMREKEEGPRRLRLRLIGDVESVQIRVRDTGVGIPWDDLPHIFEPFFTTKSGEEAGVGLGLSVVYGIINRHGGSIDVESESGRGTTFHIHLPRRQPPAESKADNRPGDAD